MTKYCGESFRLTHQILSQETWKWEDSSIKLRKRAKIMNNE